MGFTKESSTRRAKSDLAERLGIKESEISEKGITERDFPDMSLGSAIGGEFSAQMISSGWAIDLEAGGKHYEYRADKYQIRLHNFRGKNHVIAS
jgi:hypothetical protein